MASESFRTLRTALTLTHPDARHIVVTSAEPGDGKTTTLANLAVCYAQADKRTLLIDADLRRPGLTGLMDMRGPHGLSEVLRSEQDIGANGGLHIRRSGIEGLDILPSGSAADRSGRIARQPAVLAIAGLGGNGLRLILIDSPPTLATTDTAIIGRLVDGVILVVQPAKNRRRPGDARRGTARTDEDSAAGVGRQSDRLRTRITATTAITATATATAYGYGNAGLRPRRVGRNAGRRGREECVPFADGTGRDRGDDEESQAPRSFPAAWHETNRGKIMNMTATVRRASIGGSISTCLTSGCLLPCSRASIT